MALHQCEICGNWTQNDDLCDRCEAKEKARKRVLDAAADVRADKVHADLQLRYLAERYYELENGGC